jgi:hypothetical protein
MEFSVTNLKSTYEERPAECRDTFLRGFLIGFRQNVRFYPKHTLAELLVWAKELVNTNSLVRMTAQEIVDLIGDDDCPEHDDNCHTEEP